MVPGEWLVDANGGIFSIGGAPFYGSAKLANHLASPVVGHGPRPPVAAATGMTASDAACSPMATGRSTAPWGADRLNEPISPWPPTPDHKRVLVVASDGGMFAFGDANFTGRREALHRYVPIVGRKSTSDGKGYWLVAGDGGIFNYGDAPGPEASVSTSRYRHGDDPRRRRLLDGGFATEASSPSATPPSTAPPPRWIWPRSRPSRPPRTETATGKRPPTARSTPTATPLRSGANGMSLAQPVVGAALSVLSSGSGSGSSSPQGQMAAPAGYTSSQMTLDDTFSGGSVRSSNSNSEVDPGTVWDNADFGSGYSTGGKTNEATIRSGQR